jgi:hypothetical protein
MGVFVIVYKHNSRAGNFYGAVRGIRYLTASGHISMKFEPSLGRWNVRLRNITILRSLIKLVCALHKKIA